MQDPDLIYTPTQLVTITKYEYTSDEISCKDVRHKTILRKIFPPSSLYRYAFPMNIDKVLKAHGIKLNYSYYTECVNGFVYEYNGKTAAKVEIVPYEETIPSDMVLSQDLISGWTVCEEPQIITLPSQSCTPELMQSSKKLVRPAQLITITKYSYGKQHGSERELKHQTVIQRLYPRHGCLGQIVSNAVNRIIEENNLDTSYDSVEANSLGYIYKFDGRVVLTVNVVPYDSTLQLDDLSDMKQGWMLVSRC